MSMILGYAAAMTLADRASVAIGFFGLACTVGLIGVLLWQAWEAWRDGNGENAQRPTSNSERSSEGDEE